MQRIPLKTDIPSNKNIDDLIKDVHLLRDVLQTIVRQYHTQGKDRYDALEESVENCVNTVQSKMSDVDLSLKDTLSQVDGKLLSALNEVEVVKNDQARFEIDRKDLVNGVELAKLTANRVQTKMTKFIDESKDLSKEMKEDYKFILKALGGDIENGTMNITGLAITVANMQKEIDKLKNKKSWWQKIFKRK